MNQSTTTPSAENSYDPPSHCPITGLAFFMWIAHHATGKLVPTYGGPFDSYTIPQRDDGCLVRERFDHDAGHWVDGREDVGLQVVDDQAIVLEPSHPSYDWIGNLPIISTAPRILGWLRIEDDKEDLMDPVFILGSPRPVIPTLDREPSNYQPMVALGENADTAVLDWLRANTCDLRCISVRAGFDDCDVDWIVVEHHMAKPHEREIGRSHSDDPRGAVRAAMARSEAQGNAPCN